VRNFGIIGGGAVLFTGSAIAGAQTLLPLLGIGAAASVVGGGAAVSMAMCTSPFCRSPITLSCDHLELKLLFRVMTFLPGLMI